VTRLAILLVLLTGCARPDAPGRIHVDVGRSGADRVLRFYLGSYMDPGNVDSVMSTDGQEWMLDMDRIEALAPSLHGALIAAAADGLIDRDEIRAAVQSTYAGARKLPDSVDALVELPGFGGEKLVIRVRGSMTRYERRVMIPVRAVAEALGRFARDGSLTYAPGTVVVGEHLDGDRVVETTGMIRRADGFWDFVAYGPDGGRVDEIEGERGGLAAPTRCFGCHYGDRAFEPEASFPAAAADGPHGPRFVDVPERWIDRDVIRLLDEHRRRSDGLLGLYATVLAGRWKAGESGAHGALLDSLGLRDAYLDGR